MLAKTDFYGLVIARWARVWDISILLPQKKDVKCACRSLTSVFRSSVQRLWFGLTSAEDPLAIPGVPFCPALSTRAHLSQIDAPAPIKDLWLEHKHYRQTSVAWFILKPHKFCLKKEANKFADKLAGEAQSSNLPELEHRHTYRKNQLTETNGCFCCFALCFPKSRKACCWSVHGNPPWKCSPQASATSCPWGRSFLPRFSPGVLHTRFSIRAPLESSPRGFPFDVCFGGFPTGFSLRPPWRSPPKTSLEVHPRRYPRSFPWWWSLVMCLYCFFTISHLPCSFVSAGNGPTLECGGVVSLLTFGGDLLWRLGHSRLGLPTPTFSWCQSSQISSTVAIYYSWSRNLC